MRIFVQILCIYVQIFANICGNVDLREKKQRMAISDSGCLEMF